MRWYRSRWFRGAAVILILGIVAFAIWFFWIANVLAERQWEEYLAAAKQRGVKLFLRELQPEPVPKDQDWSALPVFDVQTADAEIEAQWEYMKNFGTAPRVRLKRAEIAFAPPDWAKYREALAKQKLAIPTEELDDRKAIISALQRLDPLYEQLTAFQSTAGNWPVLWHTYNDEIGNQMSVVALCSQFLSLRGLLAVDLMDEAAGKNCIWALLRMAESLERTPGIVSGLLTVNAEAKAREILIFGLEKRIWEEDSLGDLGLKILARNGVRNWRWSLITERAITREEIEHYLQRRNATMLDATTPGGGWMRRLRLTQVRAVREMQLWSQQYLEEQIEMFDEEQEIWKPATDPKFDPERELRRNTRYATAAGLFSMTSSFSRKALFNHGQNKMAALACALDLHFRKQGKYPSSLEVLVPNYLPRQPLDPCGGQPFRYRVKPDGSYLLYSIGSDLRDNQGNFGEDRTNDVDDPDWLWLTPAGPK